MHCPRCGTILTFIDSWHTTRCHCGATVTLHPTMTASTKTHIEIRTCPLCHWIVAPLFHTEQDCQRLQRQNYTVPTAIPQAMYDAFSDEELRP